MLHHLIGDTNSHHAIGSAGEFIDDIDIHLFDRNVDLGGVTFRVIDAGISHDLILLHIDGIDNALCVIEDSSEAGLSHRAFGEIARHLACQSGDTGPPLDIVGDFCHLLGGAVIGKAAFGREFLEIFHILGIDGR